MSITLPYTALVTVSEVHGAAMGAVDVDLAAEEVRSVIRGVTEAVEAYLGRTLIVRAHTDRYADIAWRIDESLDQSVAAYVSAWATAWPIVEVDSVTPSTATAPTVHGDGRRFVSTVSDAVYPIRTIVYMAGYRRADQVLSGGTAPTVNLQDQTGLSGLSTLPDLLPYDIREASLRLTLHRLTLRQHGLHGMREAQLQMGSQPVTVRSADRGHEAAILATISHHRSLL